MIKKGVSICFIIILLACVFGLSGCVELRNAVTYEVTFTASWSEATHPDDFPDNPHFSGLIGASHNDDVSFWSEGELASPGIKNMAETGSKNPLIREIAAAILQKHALFPISDDGLADSPGSISTTVRVSENYPLVTLVTMIAPSPDWFVGVDSVSLYQNERFIDELVITLYAYDAGTDSGVNYTSPDEATEPPVPVYQIEGYPFFYEEEIAPLGVFTFTKIE